MVDELDTPPSTILVLGGEETERLVAASLDQLRVRVDRLEERGVFGGKQRHADLVLLDRAYLEDPATVRDWLDQKILADAVPVLLLAPSPVTASDYRAWLDAGVWEVVRLPVDPAILSLRLRNILGGRCARLAQQPSITPTGPYPWPTLVRATEETLALGRRYNRPVSCIALAVERSGEPDEGRTPRLMYRLGVTAQEWVRDSDLVGLSEHDVLLVVLPDTIAYYADILGPRLVAALERSLRRAGTVARVVSATGEARLETDQSAADFLLATVRQVA